MGPLNFHMNSRIPCQFLQKAIWHFDRDCVQSVDNLGEGVKGYCYFSNIKFSRLLNSGCFPLYVVLNFFQSYIVVFSMLICFSFIKVIPTYFILMLL